MIICVGSHYSLLFLLSIKKYFIIIILFVNCHLKTFKAFFFSRRMESDKKVNWMKAGRLKHWKSFFFVDFWCFISDWVQLKSLIFFLPLKFSSGVMNIFICSVFFFIFLLFIYLFIFLLYRTRHCNYNDCCCFRRHRHRHYYHCRQKVFEIREEW